MITTIIKYEGDSSGRSGSYPFRFNGKDLGPAPVVAIWATCILLAAFVGGGGFRVYGELRAFFLVRESMDQHARIPPLPAAAATKARSRQPCVFVSVHADMAQTNLNPQGT